MKTSPLAVMRLGYGSAAAMAAAAWLIGAPILAVLALVWIGGAAATIAFAAAAPANRRFLAADDDAADRERTLWEADRFADAAPSADRRASGG